MPGRPNFLPALAMLLWGFAADAAAEDAMNADRACDLYRRALGPAERIRTLGAESRIGSGAQRASGVRTHWDALGRWRRAYRKTPRGQRIDYFQRGRAVIYSGRLRARYFPQDVTTRAYYYAMSALARPFALLEIANDQRARKGLRVGRAGDLVVLETQADEHAVRTQYVVDPKRGLLLGVRFTDGGPKPFASVQYDAYARVDGVQLPHTLRVTLERRQLDEERRRWRDAKTIEYLERIDRWEIGAEPPADMAPPRGATPKPENFETTTIETIDNPHDMAVGDLDGDGKPDIAVAGLGGVMVHFGGEPRRTKFVPLGKWAHRGCRIADFDLDGRPELLTMSWADPGERLFIVSFVFGGERWVVRDLFTAPFQGYDLAVTDFDRDGIPDLLMSGYGSRDVNWRFGNGVGGVRMAGTRWPLLANGRDPMRATGLAYGDLNGDGMLEVAVAEPGRARIPIFVGEPNLSFQPRMALDAKNAGVFRPVDVEIADLDGDGRPDLVFAQDHPHQTIDGDIGVMLNSGKSFRNGGYYAAGDRATCVRVADLDRDGKVDLLAPSMLTDQVSWLRGKGDGTFEEARFFPAGRGPARVECADVDGDGRPDLLIANPIDGTLTWHRQTGDVPRAPARVERKPTVVKAFEGAPFRTQGLRDVYEFAGEWRLPRDIADPSGIAFLHWDPTTTGLVVVSDKKNALFRVTVDTARSRIVVGPTIPLRGVGKERLDLEAASFDRESATLFLAAESDNSILRTTLFGEVLGRAKTELPVGDNDGIEGLALRRKRDGTPLLYVFRERLGTTTKQPPVHVYELSEDPFALKRRGPELRLPVPLVDQTAAHADGDSLYVVSRFARTIAQLEFDGDGFAKRFRTAGIAALANEILGYPALPKFGMIEGITRAANGDLYLLVDNNGNTIGTGGRNQGAEGRLIRLRCLTKPEDAPRPRRVKLELIFIPVRDEKSKDKALEQAQDAVRRYREGADFLTLVGEIHRMTGRMPSSFTAVRHPEQPRPGELDARDMPAPLHRLVFRLGVGEAEICEFDKAVNPDGYFVIRRVE
ncbi:MAG: FG-GAP-like repeat-containing protein [Planctomycetota bacterium]